MIRFLGLTAIALVAAVALAYCVSLEAAIGAPSPPIVMAEPAPPAIERCTTVAQAHERASADLASKRIPAIFAFSPHPGRDAMIMSIWIVGHPLMLSMIFVDDCLADSVVTPAPT